MVTNSRKKLKTRNETTSNENRKIAMKRKTLFTLIPIVLIFLGCATSGRIGDLPTISSNTPSSELYLIRIESFVGGAINYYIALDGKDIFSIRSGNHTIIHVPTGEHIVAVKCFGGWSPTWKQDSKTFTAEANKGNYFIITPSMDCARIYPVHEDEAKKAIAGNTFIDPAPLK